jgi:hypothetical protein
MRAFTFAAVLSIAAPVLALTTAAAQTPPPVTVLPEQGQPPAPSPTPAPPPTVLLPPSSSELAASDQEPAKPPPPVVRVRRTGAIVQVLDKSTAETLRFEAPIGQPVRWKDLIFTAHVCEDAAPGQRGASAHLEIQSSPRPIPGRETPPTRQLFRGWMFANSPGLHPFEHPVYDAWLIGCRQTVVPEPATPAPAAAAPAAPPKSPAVPPAAKPPAPPPTKLLPAPPAH